MKTRTQTEQRWRAMMALARPLVARGEDWQAVQHDLLNHFEWLTNSDDDEELTRDIIRACEDEMASPDVDEYDEENN